MESPYRLLLIGYLTDIAAFLHHLTAEARLRMDPTRPVRPLSRTVTMTEAGHERTRTPPPTVVEGPKQGPKRPREMSLLVSGCDLMHLAKIHPRPRVNGW